MTDLFIKSLERINAIHTWILNLNDQYGWALTDKQLHFWVFGVLGALIFLMVAVLFRWLAKLSISLIAFVFTFTVLLSIALAIEIEQKLTHTGVMDFNDILSGIQGFLVFFVILFSLEIIVKLFKHFTK